MFREQAVYRGSILGGEFQSSRLKLNIESYEDWVFLLGQVDADILELGLNGVSHL